MNVNLPSRTEIKKSSRDFSNNSNRSLFDFINKIENKNANTNLFREIEIPYKHVQCLSGFKSNSFSNSESYLEFLQKINQIESIIISEYSNTPNNFFRIMLLISFLFIKDAKGNDINLKLNKINNIDIKPDEIEIAGRIMNVDKVVDLINEGWMITNLNYHSTTNEIESIEFSKGAEQKLVIQNNSELDSFPPSPNSQKILFPLSPHSNQHSINRQKKQSTRQFDRTDYSNESSTTNDEDNDDEIAIDTIFTDTKNSRSCFSRRTYSAPFIDFDSMTIFENDKSKNNKHQDVRKNEEDIFNPEINEFDTNNRAQVSRRKINNIKKNKPKTKRNNNNNEYDYENDTYNHNDSYSYSYSYSNSSDFDYSYYSSGEEELTNDIISSQKNNRNYSNERRRHRHHRHQISKRIKNKLELRKLEESPNRTSNLYIDEFDDVRKLRSGHNKQQPSPKSNSHACKNNNLRDLDENNFNDSDDDENFENIDKLVNNSPRNASIKPSFSSPTSIKLTLPYELIDFDDNKNNFTDVDNLNENEEITDFDDQQPFNIKLDVKLNFNSDSNQTRPPIFNSYDNIAEEEEDECDYTYDISGTSSNPNITNNYFNEINEDYIDDNEEENLNDNSSSDSNEDFDDLEYVQRKNNNKCKLNFANVKESTLYEQDEDVSGQKIFSIMNDDIYCSEPFPTNPSNSNDNSLLSPNHRKQSRTGKKRQIL